MEEVEVNLEEEELLPAQRGQLVQPKKCWDVEQQRCGE